MDWTEQRVIWNANKECARQACRAKFDRKYGKHRHSGLLYCIRCARLINDHNPEAYRDDGEHLVKFIIHPRGRKKVETTDK